MARKTTGKKRTASKATKRKASSSGSSGKKPRAPRRAYPRATLEDALRVPRALKVNGGNAWPPDEVAKAVELSKSSNAFFYMAAAARDFGLTEGSRDSSSISLTDFGRDLVYAPSPEVEERLRREAFLKVDLFARVLEYYKGNSLPDMKYLGNTLEREFQIHPDHHAEFSDLFKSNCDYLDIGGGYQPAPQGGSGASETASEAHRRDVVTLAEPAEETGLLCFVIMPFRERTGSYSAGFFDEVLKSLIAPAGRAAGFTVETANRQGTEVIHSTIINDLLDADLVVADLSEHNPNVLFELGVRMANDKPVALIRAKGTGPVFDVDNMLRVLDYDPNLWQSTVEKDLPKLTAHIKATWANRGADETYMKLLRRAEGGG